MMPRFLLAALLISGFASSPLQAGPTFTFQASNAPGQGSLTPNVQYYGLNDFSGTILAGLPSYGILGVGTPSNSGTVLSEDYTNFSVNGSTGTFKIENFSGGADFSGTVVMPGVASTGGSFTIDGYLSSSAAAYFGLSASTQMVGTATIQLAPSSGVLYVGTLQLSFSPGAFPTPEPASVVLLGTGIAGVMAFQLRRARRSRPALDGRQPK